MRNAQRSVNAFAQQDPVSMKPPILVCNQKKLKFLKQFFQENVQAHWQKIKSKFRTAYSRMILRKFKFGSFLLEITAFQVALNLMQTTCQNCQIAGLSGARGTQLPTGPDYDSLYIVHSWCTMGFKLLSLCVFNFQRPSQNWCYNFNPSFFVFDKQSKCQRF